MGLKMTKNWILQSKHDIYKNIWAPIKTFALILTKFHKEFKVQILSLSFKETKGNFAVFSAS